MIEPTKFLNCIKNLNTFDDIYNLVAKIDNKEKGDIFELITLFLFQLSPILNNKLQHIWLYNEIPIKIKNELNLPSKDKGIDLLAIIDDEYYAIQSKFRQNYDTVISWTELSTFFGLSFGINNKIKGGFLVTNTFDLCDEVINSDKVEPIYGDFFNNLPPNFFQNIVCILNKQKIDNYVCREPFNYQLECINKSKAYFEENERGYIEMACGTGKTLTSYWIDKYTNNKLTLILVPSLYLLSQFYKDWVNQSFSEKIKIKYILVGSDADINDDIKYKSNGLILELESDKIKQLIQKYQKENNKIVIISTYQSSDKLFNVTECFDLAIFDEAHKTVGQVGKQFSLMLKDKLKGNKRMEIIKRLYMTATPKNYALRSAGKIEDDEIISMDDERFYGKEIFSYNTGQAINDKRLVEYQLLTMITENKIIEKDILDNKLIKFKEELEDEESNYIATILVILKKIHEGVCNHLVTYHNTIKKSKQFTDLLIKINDILYQKEIYVASLDGSISMSKRNKIIREYVNSKNGILCSARVLNEGVNIPIIDSICFVDGRNSTVDIIQCIGRSLRLFNGKNVSNIIIPIFINNLDDEMDNKVFENIIRILKALKSTDENITYYFTVKNKVVKNRRHIIKYEAYDKLMKSKGIDLSEWQKNIETNIWKIIDPFENTYNRLKKWIERYQKMPSETSKNNEEKKLGKWCAHNRQKKKRNKLDADKIKKLEEIDDWFWKFDPFEEKYNKLKKWVEKYKKIPSQYSKNEEERKLGYWCSNRRQDKKRNVLDANKITKLEELDGWFWGSEIIKEVIPFEETYNKLKEWIDINKKIPTETSKNEEERKLGYWCSNKKQEKKKNKLNADKIKKLEELYGWFWRSEIIKEVIPFEEKYNKLKEWIDTNKKFPSNHSKNEEERKLGNWCSSRRQDKKRNNLDANKIKNLEELDGWYWGK